MARAALLLALVGMAHAGDFGRVPIGFEPNLGQAPAEARFVARGPGYALLLARTEAVLRRGGGAVRMTLVGANAKGEMRAADPLPGKSNYLRGNDPAKWIKGVPHNGRVVCESVYEGIDLVYYGNPRELEFDFVVSPGADPASIRLSFEGALRIDASGSLEIEGASGTVSLKAPVLSQGTARIEGAFRLLSLREVGFEVGRYDRTKPLVIDPVLVYSTYLGGSNGTGSVEYTKSIAVDGDGHAYVTGITQSIDFPVANALQPQNNSTTTIKTDAFITKFSADGTSLVYSTYLGGSDLDDANDIAVDAAGCVYVVGCTRSTDFPTVNPFQAAHAGYNDAFLVKLDAAGASIVYSTYLGGNSPAGVPPDDRAFGVALDSAGRAHVVGQTNSLDFPTLNAHQASTTDPAAFAAKFETDGSLVYSTYLGGAGAETAAEVAVDASGNALVAGWTLSTNFPLVSPLQASSGGGSDAFVARFGPTGALVFSTYLGGSGADYGRDIAVDSAGNAYLVGETGSGNFPTTSAAYQKTRPGGQDAFVSKITGGTLAYSTYLGTKDAEIGYGVAVDGSGCAYVAGETSSKKFPVLNAVQSTNGGGKDAFVTKLNSAGSALVYSTYLGGSGAEYLKIHIAVGGDGAAYVCGLTTSTNFPTANAFQSARNGGQDGFVAKISP